MGSLQERLVRVTSILLAGLLLPACASRPWIASTRFDKFDYAKVILLPTVVNPANTDSELPVEQIEQAVADEFASPGVGLGPRPRVITASELQTGGGHVEFPYTAGQLARIGAAFDPSVDAAIGISVMSSSKGNASQGQKASVDLLVTFVDVHSVGSGTPPTAVPSVTNVAKATNVPLAPTKYWIASGSWSAHTLSELPGALRNSIGFQFIDVKWLAKARLKPWGSTQVFSTDEPLVTISSPFSDLNNNVAMKLRSIPLTATGIYEGGMTSLRITNDRSHFDYKLFSSVDSIWKNSTSKDSAANEPTSTDFTPKTAAAPIFLSGPVLVPLAHGSNKIVVSAVSASGKEGRHVLKLSSIAERKIHMVPIAVTRYKEFPTSNSGIRSMEIVRQAAADNNSVDLTDTLSLKPTKYEIADVLQYLALSTGVEDPAVILFSGRIARGRIPTMDGQPKETLFLLMRDSSRVFPGIGSVSLEEVANITLPRWTVVLDVCSDDDLVVIQEQLRNSLPPGSVAHVSSCRTSGQDAILQAVAEWLSSQSDPRYPQATAKLLATIKRRVPDSIVIPPTG
jgi:hypothetical protein